MKIVVPMAGLGDRFVKQGYQDPKPLIEINGKRIIEYILDMFSSSDEYIFICNEYHLSNTNMREVLEKLIPNCKIVGIPQHKKGPVHTVSYVFNEINDDEEIIISYCDNPYIWDRNDFKNFLKNNELDA